MKDSKSRFTLVFIDVLWDCYFSLVQHLAIDTRLV